MKPHQLLLVAVMSLLAVPPAAQAQKLTTAVEFDVFGYDIAKIGYPSKLVATDDGRMYYVEWWVKGAGRTYANYYMQCVDVKQQFYEKWFRAITMQNEAKIDPIDVVGLDGAVAVVGLQADAKSKQIQTVAHFYGYETQDMGIKKLSGTFKKPEGGRDYLAVSPEKNKMLWVCYNPQGKPGKQDILASGWSASGQMEFLSEIKLPNLQDRYVVSQIAVDAKCNAYFLLVNALPTHTLADTLYPPRIVRYEPKLKQFDELKLGFSGQAVPHIRMKVLPNLALAVTGMVTDRTPKDSVNKGLAMGQYSNAGVIDYANKLSYLRFNLLENLKLEQQAEFPLPDTLAGYYKTQPGGANFDSGELYFDGNQLCWIQEESYQDGSKFFRYDLLISSFDLEKGALQWVQRYEKRQIDNNSPELLSYAPPVFTGSNLHIVHLTKKGAGGAVASFVINRQSGSFITKEIVSNDDSMEYFFPKRSCLFGKNGLVLLGLGDPTKANYKLSYITF